MNRRQASLRVTLKKIIEDSRMKAKRKVLTAATLSAFLSLAAAIQAQNTGGDKLDTGKKPGKITHAHKGGKKGHKGGKKGHKGGRKHKKGNSGTTTPPPR